VNEKICRGRLNEQRKEKRKKKKKIAGQVKLRERE
jgi:hypothetical protein